MSRINCSPVLSFASFPKRTPFRPKQAFAPVTKCQYEQKSSKNKNPDLWSTLGESEIKQL